MRASRKISFALTKKVQKKESLLPLAGPRVGPRSAHSKYPKSEGREPRQSSSECKDEGNPDISAPVNCCAEQLQNHQAPRVCYMHQQCQMTLQSDTFRFIF